MVSDLETLIGDDAHSKTLLTAAKQKLLDLRKSHTFASSSVSTVFHHSTKEPSVESHLKECSRLMEPKPAEPLPPSKDDYIASLLKSLHTSVHITSYEQMTTGYSHYYTKVSAVLSDRASLLQLRDKWKSQLAGSRLMNQYGGADGLDPLTERDISTVIRVLDKLLLVDSLYPKPSDSIPSATLAGI